MSATYTRLLQLLEKWPINTIRSGRDLRTHLGKEFDAALRNTTNTQEFSEAQLTRQYNALNRILNNVHGDKYKRSRFESTASGLNLELCQAATSKEFMESNDGKKK